MNSCQSDPQEREITDIKKEETLLNLMKILWYDLKLWVIMNQYI